MELKLYRNKSGMTQEDVAVALGIPKKTYQNYEYGVREADSDVLCALADIYGITLDELFGRDAPIVDEERVEEYSLDSQEQELLKLFRDMSDEGRGVLLTVADALAVKFAQ